jgi:hypothetical protein
MSFWEKEYQHFCERLLPMRLLLTNMVNRWILKQ